MRSDAPRDFDEYFERFPAPTRRLLERMRRLIREAAPDATEKIS